eukprot:g11264.t1
MYAKAKKMKDDALAKVAIAKEKAKTMQDKAHSFAKKVGLVKNKDRTAAGKERLAKLKAKEDAIKRAKENAERKRLKKAEFAAKRRVEARKKAAASALKRKLKLQREAEVAKMRIEDEESQLFESRTRTALVIIIAWRNRLGRNRQREIFKAFKHRIWISRSFYNQTSFQMLKSAQEGRTDAVKHLLFGGADPNARDGGEFTCLMHASVKNHEKTVEAILEGGADIHRQDSDGHDALYYAIYHGMGKAAAMLLTYGANIEMKTVEEICFQSDVKNPNNAYRIYEMVSKWINGEKDASFMFLTKKEELGLSYSELMKHNRVKKKTYQEETIKDKAERLKQERTPVKRPNAITALGLLTVAEKNALLAHKIEQERLRQEEIRQRSDQKRYKVTTKLSTDKLLEMKQIEKHTNEYMLHRITRKFPRSITPALDIYPKQKPPTPLKTPPMTPSKFFPKSGHVRPEYLKRLDTIDGRVPYEYDPLYQPQMNRSPSARRVRFSDKSRYVFPRRDFNDNYVENGELKYE